MKSYKISTATITVPNLLSTIRILLIPFFIHFTLQNKLKIALVFFLLSSATDFLDGLIARTFNQRSKLGVFLDPLADKLLMDSSYILYSLKSIPYVQAVPGWLAITVVFRDVIIIAGAILITLLYGEKVFIPHLLGKITTFLQVITILLVIYSNAFSHKIPYMSLLFYLTGFFTVISGLYYVLREIGRE